MQSNILPPDAVPFPNAYIVDVTPELAKSWLDEHPTNRSVSESHVQKLATYMGSGLWQPSHNGIAFTENGTILDRMHRLHAVIRSGKTVAMLVVVNEPLENAATGKRNNG